MRIYCNEIKRSWALAFPTWKSITLKLVYRNLKSKPKSLFKKNALAFPNVGFDSKSIPRLPFRSHAVTAQLWLKILKIGLQNCIMSSRATCIAWHQQPAWPCPGWESPPLLRCPRPRWPPTTSSPRCSPEEKHTRCEVDSFTKSPWSES